MNIDRFKGTGVALATPFNDDLTVDHDSLTELVHHVSSGGVDYLVVMGTTAETATLSADEKKQILETVVAANSLHLPIVFGAGSFDTAGLTKYLKQEHIQTVDAVLSVTPYYNKPSQKGWKTCIFHNKSSFAFL